jgi:hypothetical protein
MLTEVPPAAGPLCGSIFMRSNCCWYSYVKPELRLYSRLSLEISKITRFLVSRGCEGERHSRAELLSTVALVGVFPKEHAGFGAPAKPKPCTVTVMPPAVLPALFVKLSTANLPTDSTTSAGDVKCIPSLLTATEIF